MQYRRLGRPGLIVSELSLGAMNFGNPTRKPESNHCSSASWRWT